MSSKRLEEKNEKIIRGLMKLPPNRKCINCNSMGPQYVCTNFWTFVCTACSGIHREFTHRVKSVSMAKFTTQEVEALQKGGNQLAREIFLKDWDMQRMRFPDSSNADKIREFIKDVYVNKKYTGGKHSGKPPRDTESFKNDEIEQRRASSYHSFSQSPPYEYQYEDRRYGKQFGMLNRKAGSDRGPYNVKMNSFICSPGRLHMQTYEDKFANESSGSRLSDFSVSSASDTFRYDGQSQNSQDTGCCSPSLNQGRDITTEDTRPQTLNRLAEANVKKDLDEVPCRKRTLSAGSFGSLDSSSISHRSFGSAGAGDVALEPAHSSGSQQANTSPSSASVYPGNKDLNSSFVQDPMASSPTIDLFANFSNQASCTSQFELKADSNSVSHISLNSMGVRDVALGSVNLSGSQQAMTSTFSSASIHTMNNDPFASTVQQLNTSSPSIDLFANFNNQLSSTISIEHKPATDPIPENEEWATFDLSHNMGFDSASNPRISAPDLSGNGVANSNVEELARHNPDWAPVQNPVALGPGASPMMPAQWHLGPQEHTGSAEQKSLQGGVSKAHKSTNPFDIPYDAHLEPMNTFLDMSSLESALPSAQLTNDYHAGVAQPWYSQNAAVAYVSPLPEGRLQYTPAQGPSTYFPNFPPQGPGASVGGNPFA
ncbi:hypothetical protein Cni_G27488 [Canna indica]|uniref:Arf-GAP domain-containing protein n=1 Tax=Canna indica TaxID=4628 RepID=A0AAQ3QRF9_9LILI|nr:hypothetical protein Cni_G27488 [Canna indica]